jgi:hypothetical protein
MHKWRFMDGWGRTHERLQLSQARQLSVITIIDVLMFKLFDGFCGGAEQEGSERLPCRCWC